MYNGVGEGEKRGKGGDGKGVKKGERAVSYTHLTLPTSDLV